MGISTEKLDFGLSRRERDVLTLVVAGKSNKEIAVLLDISNETVKTHMKNLMKKLGVSTRTEAAVRAVQCGLIAR